MPGTFVFPGGTVDPEDLDTGVWVGRADLNMDQIEARLGGGITPEKALAQGLAAIRETFEEAGVLLAVGSTREGLQEMCRDRAGVRPGAGWFQERLASGGWTLALSALARWSHWITPEIRRHRYDTRFFVAIMPEGQQCLPDGRETVEGIWLSPEEALARNLTGETPLSPPALVSMQELLGYRSLRTLKTEMRARPWGAPRLPRVVPFDRGTLLLLPRDPLYEHPQNLDAGEINLDPLPVGEAFSRLIFQKGVWKPIRL
jgi:8-oxo-dGTP pyrophosphatase MutT (NUDIX family)